MSTASFRQGTVVEIDGKLAQLIRLIDNGVWQVEDLRTRRITEHSESSLRAQYVRGTLRFCKSRDSQSEKAAVAQPVDIAPTLWTAAKVRRAYLRAIMGLPSTRAVLQPEIARMWQKLRQPERPPNVSTVLRWKARYRAACEDASALIDQNHRKGNHTSRIPPEVERIVIEAIDSKFLCKERGTMTEALDAARDAVNRENRLLPQALALPEPSIRSVRRLIGRVPAFDRCVARYGRDEAEKRFRSVMGHRTTEVPLSRVEMDHALIDLVAIDDVSRLPLGRPWLTGCIDDNTRNILGIHLGFEPPSYLTVAKCLKHAMLPKTYIATEYPSVKNEWLAHGVMRTLVVDNGREFHSDSLERACFSLGIEIEYAPRRKGWFKPKIERFLGTLNRGVAHRAPGTTFSNIFDKGDYNPAANAVVRLSVLREAIHRWIVDVYHEKVHRALEMPPAVKWKSSMDPAEIRLPENPSMFDAIVGRSERRALTHKGIELDALLYNSAALTALRMQLGDGLTVDVRIDDSDIGSIQVLHPTTGELIEARALAGEYAAGLSRWQHRVCRKHAKKMSSAYSPNAWLQAKREIGELVDAEVSGKRRLGKRVARWKSSGTPVEVPSVPEVVVPAPEDSAATASTPGTSAPHVALDSEPTESVKPKIFVPTRRTSSRS